MVVSTTGRQRGGKTLGGGTDIFLRHHVRFHTDYVLLSRYRASCTALHNHKDIHDPTFHIIEKAVVNAFTLLYLRQGVSKMREDEECGRCGIDLVTISRQIPGKKKMGLRPRTTTK